MRRRHVLDGIKWMLSLVLCTCVTWIAMLGVLNLTLWREGWLVQCMDNAGYPAKVYAIAQERTGALCRQEGLPETLAQQFISAQGVRTDLILNVDALYRGSAGASGSVMRHVKNKAEDTVYAHTNVIPTQEETQRYQALQNSCQRAYDGVVLTPFATFIGISLQYRTMQPVLYLCMLALATVCVAMLYRISPRKTAFGATCMQMLFGSFLTLLCTTLLSFFAVAQMKNWMPSDNIAHEVYSLWLGGLPAALLLATIGMGAVFIACAAIFSAQKE